MNRLMVGSVTNDMIGASVQLELMQEEGMQRRLPGGDGIRLNLVG